MNPVVTLVLFVFTAVAEIVGCYLPYLWLRKDGSIWLLLPAGFSLAIFAWLLSLHPSAAGRTYAAYSGIYMMTGLLWLWKVEGVRLDKWDMAGAGVMLAGAMLIFFGPRG